MPALLPRNTMLTVRRLHIHSSLWPVSRRLPNTLSALVSCGAREPAARHHASGARTAKPLFETIKLGAFETIVTRPANGSAARSIIILADSQSSVFTAVAGLADRCADEGFTCYIPILDEDSLRMPKWLRRFHRQRDLDRQTGFPALSIWLAINNAFRIFHVIRAVRTIPGSTRVGLMGVGHFGLSAGMASYAEGELAAHATFICTPLRRYSETIEMALGWPKPKIPWRIKFADMAEWGEHHHVQLDGFWGHPAKEIEGQAIGWFNEHL